MATAGNGNGEELVLFKYMERVERRFDRLERDFQRDIDGLRGEFRAFGRQVAKILANHRKRIAALERRAA